jgi:hypothetical protein
MRAEGALHPAQAAACHPCSVEKQHLQQQGQQPIGHSNNHMRASQPTGIAGIESSKQAEQDKHKYAQAKHRHVVPDNM